MLQQPAYNVVSLGGNSHIETFRITALNFTADLQVGDWCAVGCKDDFPSSLIEERVPVGYLKSIYVDGRARGVGVGRAGMEFIFDFLRSKSVPAMYLFSSAHVPAHVQHAGAPCGEPGPFYEKLGFVAIDWDDIGQPYMRKAF